ncbi:hypothetical protein [Mycobacterium sp. OTB74]|uniref:hypothetical protein n=1 Tax=Mycobacterium sp. OTB74 TaxID=1853452 RepID=UPI002473CF64|nr:hypothetical protein [Mycobacterium sp. OTB74]MDH6247259.1 hypothetical protein [Mycobacterium sp. OTB74]
MGDLPSIVDTGRQSTQDCFRRVDPPRTVQIDLAALFPRQPYHRDNYQPGGLQMHTVVQGQLTCWGRCVKGQWWGLVTYPIAFGLQRRTVAHWVPAWVLKMVDCQFSN